MTLEKQIAEQMRRVETLQKELIQKGATVEDAKLADEVKAERAEHLRRTIAALRREQADTASRFDEEIKARERELKQLEKTDGLDLVGRPTVKARRKRA
jgi:hypothetical protein